MSLVAKSSGKEAVMVGHDHPAETVMSAEFVDDAREDYLLAIQGLNEEIEGILTSGTKDLKKIYRRAHMMQQAIELQVLREFRDDALNTREN